MPAASVISLRLACRQTWRRRLERPLHPGLPLPDKYKYNGQGGLPNPDNMLFVCPLPLVVTADGLRGVFSAYGTLLDALILRDEATGASKGCGIVRFSTAAEARAAIAALDGRTGVVQRGPWA